MDHWVWRHTAGFAQLHNCTTAQLQNCKTAKLQNCKTVQPNQTVQVQNAEGDAIIVQDVFLFAVPALGTKIDFA
jgi:hypothetical protein